MKCKDDDLIAEIPGFAKETFGVKCGNYKTAPSFETPPPEVWPRCIPKVCVPYMTHHHKSMGTCNCEFDVCSEFIFDTLTSQCPVESAGPTCALSPYLDNSDEIMDLFDGTPPPDAPINSDVDELGRLIYKLTETVAKAEEVATGVAPNVTAPAAPPPPPPPPPTNSTRRKRHVPIVCSEVISTMEDINDLCTAYIDEKKYAEGTMFRLCDYILHTEVTIDDCSAGEITALEAEITDTNTCIDNLNTHKTQAEADAAAEMARRAAELTNYNQWAAEQLAQQTEEFQAQQAYEAQLVIRAKAGIDIEPTTQPPFCVDVCNNRRRKRSASNDTSNSTTLAPTTTDPGSDSNTTDPAATTTAAPTTVAETTWENTCLCPTEAATEPPTETTDPNQDNTTNVAGTAAPTAAPTTAPPGPPPTTTEAPTTTTLPPTNSTRRRRSFDEVMESIRDDDEEDDYNDEITELDHRRDKRAIKYRCNDTVTLGIMFYDIYNKQGMMASKCCCPNYRGELFNFFVTIDSPWTTTLADTRSSVFKSWKKMVEQEVKFLLVNKQYSSLMVDKLLGYVKFLGFKRTPKAKVGVEFEILMTKPHWDNDQRIENGFAELVEVYRNQSADEKTVLGRGVLGRYTKRDYIVNDHPNSHDARR